MARKLIKVKRRHIANGVMADGAHCMVALALKEVVGPKVEFSVGGSVLELRGARGDLSFVDLPFRVQGRIEDFDNGLDVKPFQFTIDIPDRYLATA